MTVNAKPTGTASGIPAGLAWGAITASVVTLAGTFLAAKLIDSRILKWNQSGYAVMGILLLSSWMGAITACGCIKRRRLMVCLAAGAVYMGILLIATALFFGGQYSGTLETGLLIFCGSLLGVFGERGGKRGRKRRKIHLRNR